MSCRGGQPAAALARARPASLLKRASPAAPLSGCPSSRHLPSPAGCRQPTSTPAINPTACPARRSLAETEALVDGVRLLGPSKWAEIKKLQVGVFRTELPADVKRMHAGLVCECPGQLPAPHCCTRGPHSFQPLLTAGVACLLPHPCCCAGWRHQRAAGAALGGRPQGQVAQPGEPGMLLWHSGSVLCNQTPSRAPPTVLGLKCSALRFHRHRMTRLLHSHKRCSRTCHLQTRVAKLPKSVLKARAHKSTSDIPLDLLLAGECCRFMLCCAVPCWAASRCAVRRHAVRCCMVLDAAQLRVSWHLCCDRAEVPLPAACALQ